MKNLEGNSLKLIFYNVENELDSLVAYKFAESVIKLKLEIGIRNARIFNGQYNQKKFRALVCKNKKSITIILNPHSLKKNENLQKDPAQHLLDSLPRLEKQSKI